MGTFIITLQTSGKRLQCNNRSASLLDALETHHIDAEYQCRQGFCGSCRLRLLKGKVCYTITPLAFIKDDEILPCCCKASGDIVIDK